MPNYASPALAIDFARLPSPDIVETIEYEALLAAYKARVLAANPDLERALNLEQSATNIILETQSYGEMLVRARVNAAAKAVMLPFSIGGDLDNLAALYNVERMAGEDDDRLRRRVQLAPEAFTTAGAEGAYIFQALSALSTLRDATAIRLDDQGSVLVTVMQAGNDPTVSTTDLLKVKLALDRKTVRPLTDVVSVASVKRRNVEIVATLTLYPGPSESLVLADVQKAMTKVRSRVALIGRDLTRSAIITAMSQEGVLDVDLKAPAEDIVVDATQCVWITKASISTASARSE